jgi:hypothetical protein
MMRLNGLNFCLKLDPDDHATCYRQYLDFREKLQSDIVFRENLLGVGSINGLNLVFTLVPLVAAWLLVYALVVIGRWIRAGFRA